MTVYFIQGQVTKRIKIGFATDIEKRFRAIRYSTSEEVRLVATMPGDRIQEGSLHRRFFKGRRHGEWFEPVSELTGFIRRLPNFNGFFSSPDPVKRVGDQKRKRTPINPLPKKKSYLEKLGVPSSWKIVRSCK